MAVRHHIKILVVDADTAHANQISSALQEGGFKAKVVSDLGDAAERARGESYQLAIVDLSSRMSEGLELIGKLKEIDRRMSIIVTRHGTDFETAVEAMRHGAAEYLRKPVKKDELLNSLERICRGLGLIHTNEAELNRLIGQRIRAERLAQNLTLRQLSDRTDLTTSQLSQVELGKNAASIWALARISNALGKQVSAMMEGL